MHKLATCVFCEGRGSELEGLLHAALSQLGWQFCVEAKAARGKHGPADCFGYAPFYLLVQVDGVQHTSKGMRGMPPRGQRAIDNALNLAAVKRGFHVARIHYADAACIPLELLHAANAATAHGCRVIWYSTSYRWPAM